MGGLERHIYQGVGSYWAIQGTDPFAGGQARHPHTQGPEDEGGQLAASDGLVEGLVGAEVWLKHTDSLS